MKSVIPPAPTPPAVKRGPGRPPGSRNKSTGRELAPVINRVAEVKGVITGANSLPVVVSTGDLLAKHNQRLAELEQDISAARANPMTLPRDMALLRTQESVTLRAIAELTGATKLTMKKLCASEIGQVVLTTIERTLGSNAKYKPAADALAKAFAELADQ